MVRFRDASLILLAVLLTTGGKALAQLDMFTTFSDAPVEITSDGETRFEGGVAIAEDNVQIHYGDISIYCDYAEYNPETRDVLLVGNIRIYTPEVILTGQRSLFNLETRQMRALEFKGEYFPLRFRAFSLQAPSLNEFRVRNAYMTTDDSSDPDYHVRSRTVRIYPGDRVVFVNSTVYVGRVPVFWFPYLYASLDNTGFNFLPGYDSRWGAFLLTAYSFPIGSGGNIIGKVRADYRTERGFALGFDADLKFGKDDRSTGEFISYHAWDQKPGQRVGGPGEPAETGQENRYRVTYRQRLFLTDDIYALFDINLLSDIDFMEDFYPTEFRVDPQPDTHITLTKWDTFYTANLLTRWQMNDFYDVTERLPEGSLDFKSHQLFGWPIYYSGENSAGYLRRAFPVNSIFQDYDSVRIDSAHQFSAPQLFFNWLSIVPRVGMRGTYYTNSGSFLPEEPDPDGPQIDPLEIESSPLNTPTTNFQPGGGIFRAIFNASIEASFKVSRTYERVQSRFFGLDGLRHIAQPYTNFSNVYNAGPSPDEVLQFDRVVPSTQLLPITFPQFTAVDSIDTWSIWRFGVRNRLQTRRDNSTFDWMTLDTFMDVNIENPYSDGAVSNLFNIFTYNPVRWLGFAVASQVPLVEEGFTEVDARVNYMPYEDLFLSVGINSIEGNRFFADSNQINFYAYWRINDNWAFSIFEQYEAQQNILLYQRYMVHRDLSSWTASLGAQIRNNQGGEQDLGLLFVLSLKDAPQVTLPLAFETGTAPLEPGAANN